MTHCREFFVRADKVLRLRSLLDELSDVKGLMTEEKDPEEFFNCLLQQIMQAEPFIKLRYAKLKICMCNMVAEKRIRSKHCVYKKWKIISHLHSSHLRKKNVSKHYRYKKSRTVSNSRLY